IGHRAIPGEVTDKLDLDVDGIRIEDRQSTAAALRETEVPRADTAGAHRGRRSGERGLDPQDSRWPQETNARRAIEVAADRSQVVSAALAERREPAGHRAIARVALVREPWVRAPEVQASSERERSIRCLQRSRVTAQISWKAD